MEKSLKNSLRRFDKEKLFNEVSTIIHFYMGIDILGFRMLVDSYDTLLNDDDLDGIRIVDMSKGKVKDDGYRGVHIYYQPNHYYYPIEIQANTYYDRQLNNWLHKYLYKREYSDSVGGMLREEYECGKILKEQDFEEVFKYVLFSS